MVDYIKYHKYVQKTTREEIISKAMEVFLQQGYHKTSMQDLANACGLEKGSFYHYFKSKQDLMKEVLMTVNQYFGAKIFSIAYQEDLNPKEKLEKMQEKAFRIFTSTSHPGCLVGNSVLEMVSVMPEFKDVFKAFFESWAKANKQIFLSKYSEAEAEALAWQAIKEIEGAIMMVRLFDNTDFLKNTYQKILSQL